ncbi:hypothetical protein [Streptomyces ureilyticus]|uniref:Uncharacterized protein n=1 Tax=Streptomyces ureilyticus TaxID=1775131 RepID=A0ABX0DJ06_9ACTN|nr:hypothetical protein [Streptomyces ureilyticus]NGO40670.1 hypothetical protein [Streptomyces ureilyticus]
MTGGVPADLYAALQVCFPSGGLPEWLTAAGSRCATGAAPIPVDGVSRAEELADLVALAWWELLQDPGDDPFTKLFTTACARHLS